MFKKSLLSIALGSVLLPSAQLVANDAIEHQGLDEETEVIVVIGKVPRKVEDVVGSVTVINSETIDNQLAHNVADLLRYQVGINVINSGSRFGDSSIAIRGISGNRIATEIDGIPVADQFSIGSYSNSGRNNVDPDLLKQVEILRGPASSIYGSDAIGGVVSYLTKTPNDLLSETDNSAYFSVKSGYYSVDDSHLLSFSSAVGNDTHSALLSAARRKGHEYDIATDNDLEKDQQDNQSQSLLAKYFYNLSDNQELSFTVDYFEREVDSDINTILGLGRFRSTNGLTGDDEVSRTSISANYKFIAEQPWLEGGVVRLYHQQTETEQLTEETRFSRGVNYHYNRDFYYQQDVTGARFNFYTQFEQGVLAHQIGYGAEWSKTTVKERRDGIQTNLDKNTSTNVILSEQFPLRDFPVSDIKEWGVYINDEISIDNTNVTIIPAIRYDKYELTPKPDAIYREDNPETEVVSINEDSFSPKLGLVYQLDSQSQVYLQYVKGFRAPPFEDANIGFDIALFKYRAIPNPDLKSETTTGYEVGYNFDNDQHKLDIVGFYNDYDDFIQTKVNLGFDPVQQRVIFQSQNIDNAKIYGVELSYRVNYENLFNMAGQYSAYANLFWSKGENKDTEQAINEIEPNHASLGLQWLNSNETLSLALHANIVEAKSDIAQSDAPEEQLAETAGYATFDVIANYHVNKKITLSAAINNITDKSYYQWSRVNGMLAEDPLLPTLAAPGINGSIQLKYTW